MRTIADLELFDTGRRYRRAWWQRLSPPQLFVGSFILLILLGTAGLKTIPGMYVGAPLGWLDALFTSTSAVCVTGLIVVDTATHFTFRGQLFILLLIQVGGLGMITFTSLIIMALGRRLSLRQESLSKGSLEVAPHVNPLRLLRDVVVFTFLFEGVGAVLLYALWVPDYGWRGAAWPAVFHSISAFCNAGFSTFSDSLIGVNRKPAVLGVIMSLIVIGGIGFLTLEELRLYAKARRCKKCFRLSLHSQIVLVTTWVLLVLGTVAFAFLEWTGTLAGMGVVDRVVNAMFLSVTARTAGFNTIDYAAAGDATNFLTVILMCVGGSPGSTAGGVKTTTVALIVLLAWSRWRGEELTQVSSRSVPEATIQRAVGLAVVTFAVLTGCILLMTVAESGRATSRPFLQYMFEVASAFNTVGLSMGATAELQPGSKVLTVVLMFVGRVGPLAFAAALTRSRADAGHPFRYAYEDVVVG